MSSIIYYRETWPHILRHAPAAAHASHRSRRANDARRGARSWKRTSGKSGCGRCACPRRIPGGTGGRCRPHEKRKKLLTYAAELEQKRDMLQALLDKALADLEAEQRARLCAGGSGRSWRLAWPPCGAVPRLTAGSASLAATARRVTRAHTHTHSDRHQRPVGPATSGTAKYTCTAQFFSRDLVRVARKTQKRR